jgi:hypothetical protein
MITPQEKAKELVDKMLYFYQGYIDKYTAKQCALIAVDELLDYTKESRFPMNSGESFHEPYDYDEYLLEVKEEIEKL